MAKRRPSTGKAGEAVLKEYSYRCSICGADKPHLHHIDENPENNDPLNLLPLCPNCHLSDQHNPTAKLDPRLLNLFRRYKDPTILTPQFLPLLTRTLFMENTMFKSMSELMEGATELYKFVAELEMGKFYSEKIGEYLKFPSGDGFIVLPESDHDKQDRERREAQRIINYRLQVQSGQEPIQKLIIELLRYQQWRLPLGRDEKPQSR